MVSPTQWTWVWVNFGSWQWTGRPGMLQSIGSQRVGHDWATELNWTLCSLTAYISHCIKSISCGSAGKESTCSMGDLVSVPGLGRFPGERNGYPLQYCGLENSIDCIVHGVTKSWTWLSEFHFTFHMKHQEFSTAVLLCWWCIYIYFYLAEGLCGNSLFWHVNLFCLLDVELYVVNSQGAPECWR